MNAARRSPSNPQEQGGLRDGSAPRLPQDGDKAGRQQRGNKGEGKRGQLPPPPPRSGGRAIASPGRVGTEDALRAGARVRRGVAEAAKGNGVRKGKVGAEPPGPSTCDLYFCSGNQR